MRRTKVKGRTKAICPTCGERTNLRIRNYDSNPRDESCVRFSYQCHTCGKKFYHRKKYTELGRWAQ